MKELNQEVNSYYHLCSLESLVQANSKLFFANGAVDLVIDYFKGRLNISLDELKILVSNLVLENLK